LRAAAPPPPLPRCSPPPRGRRRRGAPPAPSPPSRFVPGHAPPPSQPGGYAAGERPAPPPYEPLERWRASRPYLRGLDFFNRGWWWEAHESWESLWHVCEGRDEAQHELPKGLIQPGACGPTREPGSEGGA